MSFRSSVVVRQWKMLLALDARKGGMTLADLAAVDDGNPVSERTIRRDVDALILAGFPVEVRTEDNQEPAPGRRGARVYIDRTNWRGGEDAIFKQKAS